SPAPGCGANCAAATIPKNPDAARVRSAHGKGSRSPTRRGHAMNEESLFHEALARPSRRDRDQFLNEACAGNPELRAAVEALLSPQDGAGEFLASSAGAPSSDTANRDGTTDQENSPAPPAAEPDVPQRVGRYEVRRLLGRGGMGAVYLAHDPQLDRLVALKVPKLASPGAEERFLREARAAAAVTHPHLCPGFAGGPARGGASPAAAFHSRPPPPPP